MREWLKNIRTNAGKTMKTVAIEAGISECYYCQIEGGVRNVSVKKKQLKKAHSWQNCWHLMMKTKL